MWHFPLKLPGGSVKATAGTIESGRSFATLEFGKIIMVGIFDETLTGANVRARTLRPNDKVPQSVDLCISDLGVSCTSVRTTFILPGKFF